MAALLFIFQATGIERAGRRRPGRLVSPGNALGGRQNTGCGTGGCAADGGRPAPRRHGPEHTMKPQEVQW
ncbi:hypothetical protein D5047_21175 [Verminephrobacter eiseniae]|nr:hypothetical protein [Verminephrobacter eiseniae]